MRAQNIIGLAPRVARDADVINDQVDEFKNLLGYDNAGGGGTAGALDVTNFASNAGIREDKIAYDTATGHNHPLTGGSGSGAALAPQSVTDLQIAWDGAITPLYMPGNKPGLVVRFGSFTGIGNQLLTSGDEDIIRIYFSTGTPFDRVPSPARTAQVAGAIFPSTAVPVVLVTAIGDGSTVEGDVRFAVIPDAVTNAYFDILVDPDTTGGTTILGFSWVAFYDPSQGS